MSLIVWFVTEYAIIFIAAPWVIAFIFILYRGREFDRLVREKERQEGISLRGLKTWGRFKGYPPKNFDRKKLKELERLRMVFLAKAVAIILVGTLMGFALLKLISVFLDVYSHRNSRMR